MSRQHAWWLGALLLGMAWLESCGAMTIETSPPDEPVVMPRQAPRLVRRDAAADAGEHTEDDGG